MNKKIVIMLAAVVAVVSVILVSIIGQIPNYDTSVMVREIIIEGYEDPFEGLVPCDVNANGDKIIWVDNVVPEETMLQLRWTVSPDNAYNTEVRFSTGLDDGSVTVSAQGLVIFHSETRTSALITLTAADGSLTSARVYIMQRSSDSGDFWG